MPPLTNLTIDQVASLRDALFEKITLEKELWIDLGGVQEIDMAGLQLLVSCLKTTKESGKEVHLANLPDCLQNKARAAGIDLPVSPV